MVGGVTGILLVLGFIANPQRRDRDRSQPTIVPPRAVPVAFKNVGLSNEPTPIIEPSPDPASAVVSSISLTLEFDQDSFTKIVADGRTVLNGLVRRGEKRRLEAHGGFRVTLGNAGGVRVSVDGHALDPLGGAGEVIRDVPLPSAPSRG